MTIILIASLVAVFCSDLAVTQVQNNSSPTCAANYLNFVLGTNNYLLYGMTADCQLFFATNVPYGTDLGKQFGPSGVNRYYCKGARLFPIRNANNTLMLLMVFEYGPTFYYNVFNFKMPTNGQWFSLTTGGQNNTPVAACVDSACAMTPILSNFTTLFTANSQSPTNQVLGFVYTDNSFNIFYRDLYTPGQVDLNVYYLNAQNQLMLNLTSPNVLTSQIVALIPDPYLSTLYVFDSNFMYQYVMNSTFKYNMTTLADLNNYAIRNKLNAPFDGHSYNYYVANDYLVHLQYPQSTMNLLQANITVQTIPTNISNPAVTSLSALQSTCIGFLNSPNNQYYSSVDNFQMSILFQNDYNTVAVQSAAVSVHCSIPILLLALVTLIQTVSS